MKVKGEIAENFFDFVFSSSRIRKGEKKSYEAQLDTQLISNILKQVCMCGRTLIDCHEFNFSPSTIDIAGLSF